MQKFENILFIANGQDSAAFRGSVRQALELARANRASLTIADVVEPLSSATAMVLKHAVPMDRVRSFREAERRAQLSDFIASELAQAADIAIKCQVVTGTPYIEIIRMVLRGRHDLVIKTAQESNIVGQLFGSTDLHLVRKCPCPVWLTKQEQPEGYARVLAAVDIGQQDASGANINNAILGLAASIAGANGSELHVLQCWDLPSDNLLRRALGKFGPEDKNRLLQLTEKNYHHWINELLEPYAIDKSRLHLHLKQGDPKVLIPYTAQKHGADLIIMGTIARAGIEGLIVGSTAEEALKKIKTSVLAVKPAGFSTPVKLPAPAGVAEDVAA